MKKTWAKHFLIMSLPVLKQLRGFLILYLAVFLFVYGSMVQLSDYELSVTCRVLPSNPQFFPLRKEDLVIWLLHASQLAECCFLQLFMARHLKPQLLFFACIQSIGWAGFQLQNIWSFEDNGIGYKCSEMLQDLLDIFFLPHNNLLHLEEGSADVDLMDFEDWEILWLSWIPCVISVFLAEVQLILHSGIILSCKPTITSSAASFAESTDGVQCIYPITQEVKEGAWSEGTGISRWIQARTLLSYSVSSITGENSKWAFLFSFVKLSWPHILGRIKL